MKKSVTIALVILLTGLLLSCATPNTITDNKGQSTVSVSASARVELTPDVAKLVVTVAELGETTEEALQKVNAKIARILELAELVGVAKKDMATLGLSLYPEYRWVDGGQELVGQKATQRVQLAVRNVDEDFLIVSRLLDAMSSVDGISLSALNFSKEDTAEAYSLSRTLAVEKAWQKASDYASAANLKIVKALTISDSYDADVGTVALMKSADAVPMAARLDPSVPVGDIEVTSTVHIVFLLE